MSINIFLIRLLQFATFAVFLFAVLVYSGIFLLLPLDILFQITRMLHAMGLPVILALAAGCGAMWYVGKKLWQMTELWQLVVEVGMLFVDFGREQIKRYDELLAVYRQNDLSTDEE